MGYASTPSSTSSAGATSQRPVRRRRPSKVPGGRRRRQAPGPGGPGAVWSATPCDDRGHLLGGVLHRRRGILLALEGPLDLRADGDRDLVVVGGHEAVIWMGGPLQDGGRVGRLLLDLRVAEDREADGEPAP